MRVERVVPILTVANLAEAVAEHTAVLGFEVVMDHGWIVTLADAYGHQLSLITVDASATTNPDVSVFVDGIENLHAAHRAAEAAGLEIVHPLQEEPWGVTRFFYLDSAGHVINVGTHS